MILTDFRIRPTHEIIQTPVDCIITKLASNVEITLENCTDAEVDQLIEQFVKLKKEAT